MCWYLCTKQFWREYRFIDLKNLKYWGKIIFLCYFNFRLKLFLLKLSLPHNIHINSFKKKLFQKNLLFRGCQKPSIPYDRSSLWLKHFLKDKEKALYSQRGYKTKTKKQISYYLIDFDISHIVNIFLKVFKTSFVEQEKI